MRIKIWLKRFLLRWTPKNRAVRRVARELDVKEKAVFELVVSVEKEAVNIARQIILEAKQMAAMERRSAASSRPYPQNQRTSGARLSSPYR